MAISESTKKEIDEMDYTSMLRLWRFAPAGHPMFKDETGDYFAKVMADKRGKTNHVRASKDVGWER